MTKLKPALKTPPLPRLPGEIRADAVYILAEFKARARLNELNDPRHADFKKRYVQTYIRDYGDSYKKCGYYYTDAPRKCEANALLFDIDAGMQWCEEAIQEQLQDPDCVLRHVEELDTRRPELRELVEGI